MTSREGLELFYKDVKAYNEDMRKYPAYYFNQEKYEPELQKWSKKQDDIYKMLLDALNELDELKKNKKIMTKEELAQYLYDNYYNKETNTIDLSRLNFGGFNCSVDISCMLVGGNLDQSWQHIDGDLDQSCNIVGGSLDQSCNIVGGKRYQRKLEKEK